MKGKRIIFGFWILMTIGFMSSSCTKEGSEGKTIIPIGEEKIDVEELFSEVKPSFDEVRIKLGIVDQQNATPSCYEDLIPPKLEGSYVMNQTMLVESNMENTQIPASMSDVTMSFMGQHNSIAVIEFTESSITQKTDSVYIIGNDNGFAAYFIENKEYDQAYNCQTYHVKIKRGVIMCGSVTGAGLSGVTDGHAKFRYASIILKWENDPAVGLPQFEPGTYFIYEEGDGVAEKL